jgi:hypothetical protein
MSRAESGNSRSYNRPAPAVLKGLNAFFDNVVGQTGISHGYDELRGVTVDVISGHAARDGGRRRQMTPPGGDKQPGEGDIEAVLVESVEVRAEAEKHIGEVLLKKMELLDPETPNDASAIERELQLIG